MRGDQLSRQWPVVRAIEASPNGLTEAEIGNREETGIRDIYRDLKAFQAARFPLWAQRAERFWYRVIISFGPANDSRHQGSQRICTFQ